MKVKRLSKTKPFDELLRLNDSSKAQQMSSDKITTLPQPVVETILCLLPIEEAARTSILSREWRYKWTKIPKLVFSYDYVRGMMDVSNLLLAIHQVMSLRQDPIHEFTLSLDQVANSVRFDYNSSCELDYLLHQLSRNHLIKKLKLYFGADGSSLYNIPVSIFAFCLLTELYLGWCGLDHRPIFDGFGSLISLTLYFVRISRKTLLHLLSKCPSLKTFSLFMLEYDILGHERSTMIELFECLPVIEHLTIWSEISPWFVPDLVPRELPTSLVHLKYFCFKQMTFHDGYGLTFLAVLIKSSPNLEKLELEIDTSHFLCDEKDDSDLFQEYHSDVWLEHLSDVWLEHLIELKIEEFSNLEPELEFVKFILARSPKLKKVSIESVKFFDKDQELGMLKALLRAPKASGVEIDVV